MMAVPRERIKRPRSELSAGSGAPSSKSLNRSLALSNSDAWSEVSFILQHTNPRRTSCWDDQGDASEGHQRRAGLSGGDLESRFGEIESSTTVSRNKINRRTQRNSFQGRGEGSKGRIPTRRFEPNGVPLILALFQRFDIP
jgi:hypothetical protein